MYSNRYALRPLNRGYVNFLPFTIMATKPTSDTGQVTIRLLVSAPFKDTPYTKREFEITTTQVSRDLCIEDVTFFETEIQSRFDSIHGHDEFQSVADRLDKANRAIVAITKDASIGTQAAAIIKTIK